MQQYIKQTSVTRKSRNEYHIYNFKKKSPDFIIPDLLCTKKNFIMFKVRLDVSLGRCSEEKEVEGSLEWQAIFCFFISSRALS